MNYVWEVVLKAEKEHKKRESLHFIPAKEVSPYTEIAWEDWNQDEIEKIEVEVNPMYRFAQEFALLFDENIEGLEKTRLLFFDIVMHYIVQLDLRQGLSKQEYYYRFFLQDFLNGICGEEYMELMDLFSTIEIRKIMIGVWNLTSCGTSLLLFRHILKDVYPESFVYSSNDTVREILIYIGRKETPREQIKVESLLHLFLPINYTFFLFWEHHFGIVDVEKTMCLEEFVLF